MTGFKPGDVVKERGQYGQVLGHVVGWKDGRVKVRVNRASTVWVEESRVKVVTLRG